MFSEYIDESNDCDFNIEYANKPFESDFEIDVETLDSWQLPPVLINTDSYPQCTENGDDIELMIITTDNELMKGSIGTNLKNEDFKHITTDLKLLPSTDDSRQLKQDHMKNFEMVELGMNRMQPWYFSPYPKELTRYPCIYLCEFCLKYMWCKSKLHRHLLKCPLKHPPGKEIYRADTISIFEIDGRKKKTYCQNLALMAKLYLDHKALYYNMELFLFYVMTINDNRGCHIVGYFSKEKQNSNNTLACILVLPPYQKKGYGRFLIEFSYKLSKIEGRIGSPEKPLSNLGQKSYNSYWSQAVMEFFIDCISDAQKKCEIPVLTINQIAEGTQIHRDDVIATVFNLRIYFRVKREDSFVIGTELINKYKSILDAVPLRVDPQRIRWTSTTYPLGPKC